MTGKEMLSQFILSLNTYLGFDDDLVLENVIINGNLLAALGRLKGLAPPQNFITLIDSLTAIINVNSGGFLENPYAVTGTIETIDFLHPDFEKKNRAFAYSDTDFGFFSSKSLIDAGAPIDLSLPECAMLWKQMQEFLERCYTIPEEAKIIILLDCIRHGSIDTGFVINKNSIVLNQKRLHSFIYLSYLNNSKSIDLPQNLKYSTPIINNTITLDPTKIYEQFFDIYDVLNELNQAPDLISRFLKLYHILEYLVYRVYLVDLATRVGSSKFFVREYAISAESMKKAENTTFINNFQEIFRPDLPQLRADLTPHSSIQAKAFLRNKGIVKGFEPSNLERIAQLVYGLRCSIVHNKESEYHLTIANSEDYLVIIPLITQLIKTVEFLIVKKIADNHATIKYPQQQLNLY